MISCPREPSANDQLTATYIAELVRYLRAITPLEGPNVRLQRTPNGTHFAAAAAAETKLYVDRGCWKIASVEPIDDGDKLRVRFANPYYRIGGKYYEFAAEEGEETVFIDIAPQGEILIALVDAATIPAREREGKEGEKFPQLETFEGDEDADKSAFSAMQEEAERDLFYYRHPLYLFRDGALEVDFRNVMKLQMYEA